MVWQHNFFQYDSRISVLVHFGDADFVPVPRSRKVLHASLAADWNRHYFDCCLAVLHCVAAGDSCSQWCSHCSWYFWLDNYGGLRLFRIPEVQCVEKWRNSSRIASAINNDNNASKCFSSLIIDLRRCQVIIINKWLKMVRIKIVAKVFRCAVSWKKNHRFSVPLPGFCRGEELKK